MAFDVQAYLDANPDVAMVANNSDWTDEQVIEHYVNFGYDEGRVVSWNTADYLALNPDVAAALATSQDIDLAARAHYNLFGHAEGRAYYFDAEDYLAANPDLVSAGITTEAGALQHYMLYGRFEGRLLGFDAEAYLEMYPDLAAAGVTEDDALAHYMAFGEAEGRAYDPIVEDAVVPPANNVSVVQMDDNPYGEVFHLSLDGDPGLRGVSDVSADGGDGTDTLRLTGDTVVRIDFTDPSNQIKGLDLNGNGVIDQNGVENNIQGLAANFEIIDAYARNPLNTSDSTNNFLGTIIYDGTGFEGDGVNTDGNIFLGGLGNDTALGGIGNDFLAGGGGSDLLSGGRNADFFFAELSLLDPTDGNSVMIRGGATSDDAAVGNNTPQDSDWLLIEASDDDEPVTIDLSNEGSQTVTTYLGQSASMNEVENVDASGNLYGFLDGIDVSLGANGHVTDGGENVGIGSSAQMHIIGSVADNILIGGFDNDLIEGDEDANADASDDLLMGGNLNYLNNPNMMNIVNDGMDEMYGYAGNDHIVFEADGGIIDGGADTDTLWLTDLSLGTQSAADMTDDSTLRFDLAAQTLANSAGYGGADVNGTQDQTNYSSGGDRVNVDNMENVIATGLGAIDYLAAGSNDPDLTFNNQQNFMGYDGDLDLRGTNAANTLYANTGSDYIEGRGGDDKLSGGDGLDHFVFDLNDGDGLDVIHRQTDIGDNLTDGTFGQDFGINSASSMGASSLVVDFGATDLSSPDVAVTSFTIDIGGVTFSASAAELAAAQDAADVADIVNAAFHAQDVAVTAMANGNTVVVYDAEGRDISDTVAEGYLVGLVLANGNASAAATFNAAGVTTAEDTLVFASYEDRADGELVDDNGFVNSTGDAVTLGADGYAEDLVVRFDSDGNGTTVLAEDQQWDIQFSNLADEDTVTVSVNGTAFSLQMGVAADGTAIAEDMDGFLGRLQDLINAGSDSDTLAGTLVAAYNAGTDTLSLTQGNYYTGQVAFMDKPVVTLGNASGGEPASYFIDQPNTDSEITLLDFNGRNAALNADNVLFLGGSGMNDGVVTNADNSRAILATADDTLGGVLMGSDALVVDSMTDADLVATDFSLHGDDLLFGGDADDIIEAGTGDDRIFGSKGDDTVDGGKDLYVVQTLENGQIVETVETMNDYEAGQREGDAGVLDVSFLEEDTVVLAADANGDGLPDNADGFVDQLIFSTADFDGTYFKIIVSDDLQQQNGGEGTVLVNEGTYGVDDVYEHSTEFVEMEAVRTLSGDGTHAGQGNDILDVQDLSDAVAASVVNDEDASVVYNMTSDLGFISIVADLDGDHNINPADADDVIDEFLAVDGVEHLVGGNANDTLMIDESEVNKDNSFDGDTQVTDSDILDAGDTISYDHSDMDNDGVGDLGAADNDALAMRPSATVTIGAGEVDTVAFTGGTIVGSDTTTDTLTDVETIDLNDAARSLTLDDTLDVTAIDDVTVNFTTDAASVGLVMDGADVQARIDEMTELENTVMGDGDDTVLVGDTMTNVRAVASAAIDNNSFLFFNAATLNSMQISNQGLFTFDFGDGNADVLDYRDEDNQDIAVVLDYSGDGEDRIIVATDIDAADLNAATDRVDLAMGADIFYAGSGDGGMDSIIDLSQHTSSVDVVFSPNVVADENERAIDIRVAGVSISKQFMDDGLTDAERADLVADAGQMAFWNRIEGNDLNETISLTDYVSGHNMAFNLQGGTNVIDYNAVTVGTTLNFQSLAGNATQQTVTISTEDNHGAMATHTATADIGTMKVQGSGTGDDYLNLQNVSDNVAYSIDLNIPDGPGLKGTITFDAFDSNNDGDVVDAGDFQANVFTVSAYENVAGNDADNSYIVNPFVNDIYMGNGDDTLIIDTAGDLAGDTIVGDMSAGGLAATQADIIADTLAAADMAVGNDTLLFTGNLTNGDYTIDLNDGTADQFTGGAGSSAAVFGFENVDASGVTDINDVFHLTGSTQSDSILRGGAANDFLTAAGDGIVDGGGGADTIDFGAGAVVGEWATGDSNAASADVVANFTSGTDGITVMVDMDTAGLTNVAAGFDTGALADRVLSSGVVSAYYDTTNNDLLVDMDADGVNDATGDLTIGIDAVAIGDVMFDITGTGVANNITGGGADDTITGGGGNDIMDGGQVDAVGETLTFQFNAGSFTTTTADGELEIAGLEFNEDGNVYVADGAAGTTGALVQAGVAGLADGMDSDAVGSAVASIGVATWEASSAAFAAGDLASVSYNASTNVLTFNFNYAAGDKAAADLTAELFSGTDAANDIQVQATAEDAGPVNSTDTASYADQVSSNDTFNIAYGGEGHDTINNFDINNGGFDDVIALTGDNDTVVNGLVNDTTINVGNLSILAGGLDAFNIDNVTDLADLTSASVAADLAGIGLQGHGDVVYVAYDDGTDTGIFHIDDANGDGIVDASEVELLITLSGVVTDNFDADNVDLA